MKVIKPQKLSVLTRGFEFRKRFHLGVSILLYVPLSQQADLWSEAGMWKFCGEELGKDGMLEAGIPKQHAEFLVAGHAYPPTGEAVPACAVRVRLGTREKILLAFGDRFRTGPRRSDRATEPAPFTRMPIGWDRAYGGAGHADNPLGKGAAAVEHNGRTLWPMPNIEIPDVQTQRSEKSAYPAGFGVIDQTWPARTRYAGTYDDAWLKGEFPGFPNDIDWRFFNLASADQWMDKAIDIEAPYELENLHPEQPLLKGRLPGLLARCFLTQRLGKGSQESAFHELSMALKTVWMFPHRQRAILIFQGSLPVAEQDGDDVTHLLAAVEGKSAPRPLAHYREVQKRRLDPQNGVLHALRESDLLPAELAALDPGLQHDVELTESRGLMRRNLRKKAEAEIERARATVASFGLDPDEHAPARLPAEQALPDLEHLPAFIEKIRVEAEARQKAERQGAAQKLADAEALFQRLGLDFSRVKGELSERPAGPPTFSAQTHFDTLNTLAVLFKSKGIPTGELDGYLNDAAFRRRLFEAEDKLLEMYRRSAHLQEPAQRMSPAQSAQARERVATALRAGQSLAGFDLTGADLSALDLRGANLEQALLENAKLDDADLSGCKLNAAVLSRCSLRRTRFLGAQMESANLGGALCEKARFDGANLRSAILHQARLGEAVFHKAQLEGADLRGAIFDRTDWTEASAPELFLMEADLSSLCLRKARLPRALFIKCNMVGIDLTDAELAQATFIAAAGQGAKFQGADLRNARFVSECNMAKSNFSGALMDDINLRGTNLRQAQFTGAAMDRADCSGCDLAGADLTGVLARQARLAKADLSGARLIAANLMSAVLERGHCGAAGFQHANLYGADLARVFVDGKTRFDGALLRRCRTYPRLNQLK